MEALRIAVVLGQAAPPGRLARAAEELANAIGRELPEVTIDRIDLSRAPVELCDGRRPEEYGAATRASVDALVAASAVVLCSPVYRATFTGVLKNLLDLLPVEALRDKPVALVAMGASDHHFLGVEAPLRAILSWFGALALPNAVYLTGRDFDVERRLTPEARTMLGELASALVRLTRATRGISFGPPPLATRAR